MNQRRRIAELTGYGKRAGRTPGIDRLELDGAPPDTLNIFQNLLRSFQIQSTAIRFVIVEQTKRAVDFNILRRYARRAEIEFGRENRFTDFMYVRFDNIDRAIFLGYILEKTELLGQVFSQVIPDEAEIIILRSNFKCAFRSLFLEDSFPYTKTQMIRVRRQ